MDSSRPARFIRAAAGRTRREALRVSAMLALALAGSGGGCAVGALVGGMADSAHRAGSHDVEAEYTELQGRSFAAVVAADRATQARFSTLAAELTGRINTRIAEAAGASGWVPPDQIVAYLNNNPSWPAWPRDRLIEEFGVDRLIVIDLAEFRLYEVGNQHLWDGLAHGTVSVFEADSASPDFEAFAREIRVAFPDQPGYGPGELPEAAVATELLRRFVDRTVWLFHDHEEPNVIPY